MVIFDGDTQLLHQVTGTGPDFVDTKVGGRWVVPFFVVIFHVCRGHRGHQSTHNGVYNL